jgi:hypothetical protein
VVTAAAGPQKGYQVLGQRKATPVIGGDALHPSGAHTLYEHQEGQEHIKYAHQPQYGAPVDINGSNVKLLFADHGSTSLPMVVCLYGLPYLHANNCARSVLGCKDIKYLILNVFYDGRKGEGDDSDNFCLYFWHYRRPCPAQSPLPRIGTPRTSAQGNPGHAREEIAWRKGGALVTDSSEEVAQLELQGLGVQVALLPEVREIEKAYVVIDAGYRNREGGLAPAIAIDDLL